MTPQGMSYVSGASERPLLGLTIGAQLDQTAVRFPDNEALVVRHQDVRWSYGTLTEKVDEFAAGLLALGLEPGDRIGIWSPNNSEWAVTQFAAAKAGLILVNINPAYRLTELEYALNKVECRALVTAESFKSSRYIEMLRKLAPELDRARPGGLKAEKLPHLETVVRLGTETTAGMYNFDEVPSLAGAAERDRLHVLGGQLQFDDPINIQFTSGTTGFPKGATLSHHNILNNGYFNGVTLGLSERDRVCIPVPLYHCFGMVMGNLMSAASARPWSIPAMPSTRWRCSAPSRPSAARCSMASPPCSSPSSTIPSSRASISPRSVPARWRARPAPSRSCAASSASCTWKR